MFLLRFTFWSVRVLGRLFVTAVLLGGIGLVVYTCFWLPPVSFLADENPETTAFIERSREVLRKSGRSPTIRQVWTPLDEISPELVKAVRIAEDDRFFMHNGFDFTEIKIAMETNLREKRWVRGASTLSQQLAKNLYLSPEKTLSRKFDEMLLTWKLEQALTKERILEIYLNVAEWGHGCFGAEAASRFYFSKPSSKLTAREAANLAARLPNPHYLGSHSGENRRKAREKKILARMKKERVVPGRSGSTEQQVQKKKPRRSVPLEEKPPEGDEPMVLRIAKWGERAKGAIGEWFQDRNTITLGFHPRGNDNSTERETPAAQRGTRPSPPPKAPPAVPQRVKPEPRRPSSVPSPSPARVVVEPPKQDPGPLPAREEQNAESHAGTSLLPANGDSQLFRKLVQLRKAWSE